MKIMDDGDGSMLKIVLCDDDIKDLQYMNNLVERYRSERGISGVEISTCSTAADLICRIENGEFFDIYILDILLEEEDGISLGRTIRESARGKESSFIYVSSSSDFALGAFGVYASGYFLKPVEESRFAECMDRILNQRAQGREKAIAVKSRDGIISVDVDRLMKVENTARVMQFSLEGGAVVESVYIRRPFEEQLKNLLQDRRFIQPHKSFIVNMAYVERMLPHDFIMTDGTVVPISRNNLTITKKRYLEYLSREK